jgi:putative sigma-54 modulation protein
MNPPVDSSKIIMQGIHVDLTPALQQAIHGKFETLLRHDPNIVRLNIRLHKDQKLGRHYHYRATAQVECRGPDIVAEAENKEAYATLDELSQKLDEQLQRRHERYKDKRNHPHGVEIDSHLPKIGESRAGKPGDEE